MNLEKGTILRCTKDFVMIEDGLGTDIRAGDVAFMKGKLYVIKDVNDYDGLPEGYELDSDICRDGETHSMERSELEEFFEEVQNQWDASETLDEWEWLF